LRAQPDSGGKLLSKGKTSCKHPLLLPLLSSGKLYFNMKDKNSVVIFNKKAANGYPEGFHNNEEFCDFKGVEENPESLRGIKLAKEIIQTSLLRIRMTPFLEMSTLHNVEFPISLLACFISHTTFLSGCCSDGLTNLSVWRYIFPPTLHAPPQMEFLFHLHFAKLRFIIDSTKTNKTQPKNCRKKSMRMKTRIDF